jgi:hypothetical protein
MIIRALGALSACAGAFALATVINAVLIHAWGQ